MHVEIKEEHKFGHQSFDEHDADKLSGACIFEIYICTHININN